MVSIVTERKKTTLSSTQNISKDRQIKYSKNSAKDVFLRTAEGARKNISFSGKQYPSGYYDYDEVCEAKKHLSKDGSSWKQSLYYQKLGELKRNRPSLETTSRSGGSGTIDLNNSFDRFFTAIITCGISEGVIALENKGFERDARDYAHRISNLRDDMKNERANEKRAEAEVITKDAERKIEYDEKMHSTKQEQIKPKFNDLIQLKKEGRNAKIPNCLMIVSPSDYVSKELIKWTGQDRNINFISTKSSEDVLEHLERAEERYQQTQKRTLLHIDKFEDLINPSKSPSHQIAGLKDIMSCASEEYHTTIIFSTQDPGNLDHIATQAHRVEKINADFKMPDEISVADAWDRLSHERAQKIPVATVNDLLIYTGMKHVAKLQLDHSSSDLDKVSQVLKEKVTGDYAKKALSIAVERLR